MPFIFFPRIMSGVGRATRLESAFFVVNLLGEPNFRCFIIDPFRTAILSPFDRLRASFFGCPIRIVHKADRATLLRHRDKEHYPVSIHSIESVRGGFFGYDMRYNQPKVPHFLFMPQINFMRRPDVNTLRLKQCYLKSSTYIPIFFHFSPLLLLHS